jgi:hypothetical protein
MKWVWGALVLFGGVLLWALFTLITSGLWYFESSTTSARQAGGNGRNPLDDSNEVSMTRHDMRAVAQWAELIRKRIRELEKEVAAYQEQYRELEVGEEGRKLIDDTWVVQYFVNRHGEPLPHEEVGRFCRERLDELLFTLRKALAEDASEEERAAFEVPEGTIKRLKLIEFEVNEANRLYKYHRDLLTALVEELVPGEPVTPQTLRDAARRVKNKLTLEGWGHPDMRRRGSSDEDEKQPSGDDSDAIESDEGNHSYKQLDDRDSAPLAADGDTAAALLRDVRRAEQATGTGFAGRTLGRDTVRDRDEPPRLRGGQ